MEINNNDEFEFFVAPTFSATNRENQDKNCNICWGLDSVGSEDNNVL